MSTEDVKATLSRFKGVGPKTISCVLMFTLNRAEFPVDTHVWRISKRLGWVPPTAGEAWLGDRLREKLRIWRMIMHQAFYPLSLKAYLPYLEDNLLFTRKVFVLLLIACCTARPLFCAGLLFASTGREQAYEHLNRRLPSELKYDLHVLLVAHGKVCATCAAVKGKAGKGKGGPGFEVCPLRPVGKAVAAPAAASKGVKAAEEELAMKVPPAPQSSLGEEDKFVPETPPVKKQKR
jgi:hypothetical protein